MVFSWVLLEGGGSFKRRGLAGGLKCLGVWPGRRKWKSSRHPNWSCSRPVPPCRGPHSLPPPKPWVKSFSSFQADYLRYFVRAVGSWSTEPLHGRRSVIWTASPPTLRAAKIHAALQWPKRGSGSGRDLLQSFHYFCSSEEIPLAQPVV